MHIRWAEDWKYSSIHSFGSRWRSLVSFTPRPLDPPVKPVVPIEQEAGWAPRVGLDISEKRKVAYPQRDTKPEPSSP